MKNEIPLLMSRNTGMLIDISHLNPLNSYKGKTSLSNLALKHIHFISRNVSSNTLIPLSVTNPLALETMERKLKQELQLLEKSNICPKL